MAELDTTRRDFVRMAALGGTSLLAGPALAGLLEACGQPDNGATKLGGTVSYALSSEPKVLNPPIHTLLVESTVMSLLFAGLVRTNNTGGFEPELAERFSVEDGGMTYRFTLRPNLRWADGKPLTARDVVFTHQLYVDPNTRTAYLEGWDKVDRVESPDDVTVVFRMREIFAPFLLDVGTNPILPQHVLAGVADIRKDPFSRSPMGAGPFVLKEWQTGSQLVLDANPNYWRGKPKIDRLVFKVVPDATTQVNQLQAGEVDIVSVADPALWKRVQGMSGVATTTYDDTRYALVQLDEYNFLKEMAVRQALDYATPKQDLIKGVLRGLAVQAHHDVPPGSLYYNKSVEHHDYDPARAKDLLRKAGFTMTDGVMMRGGQPLEVPIYTIPTSPTFVQVAEVLKESWAKIGVKTSTTTMESATLFSNAGPQWNGKDAALIFSWGQGTDPYNYINWSSKQIPADQDAPGENGERYVNPTVDELVVRGVQTAEVDQRKRVYDQLQQILAREVPVIFLYWPKALFAHSSRVRGFAPNAFSGIFTNVWDWTRS